MPLPPSSVSSGRNKRESPSQLRNFGTAKSRARWVRPEVGGRKPVLPFGLFFFFLRKTPRLQNYWFLPCHLTTHYSVDPTSSRNKAARRWEREKWGEAVFPFLDQEELQRHTQQGKDQTVSTSSWHCFWEGNKNGLLSNF